MNFSHFFFFSLCVIDILKAFCFLVNSEYDTIDRRRKIGETDDVKVRLGALMWINGRTDGWRQVVNFTVRLSDERYSLWLRHVFICDFSPLQDLIPLIVLSSSQHTTCCCCCCRQPPTQRNLTRLSITWQLNSFLSSTFLINHPPDKKAVIRDHELY